MADTPTALQLRLLQTIVEVAAEKNSTLVVPFPVELLRFLEKAANAQVNPDVDQQARPGPQALPQDPAAVGSGRRPPRAYQWVRGISTTRQAGLPAECASENLSGDEKHQVYRLSTVDSQPERLG
jgi:hypothetical protein